jgi:hypothetical protein
MPQFHKLAELRSSAHTSTQVGYDFSTVYEGLVRRGEADVAIVSTEDGYSPAYGRPHRDFYYNITYEAIAYACLKWQCKKLAISHLCGSGKFHSSMAICHAEALGQFCDEHPSAAPESFVFCGCCIEPSDLSGIRILNVESGTTRHRPIKVETETRGSASLLHLEFE